MRKVDEKFVIEKIKKHLAPQWQVVSEKELYEKGCDLVLKDVKNKRQAS